MYSAAVIRVNRVNPEAPMFGAASTSNPSVGFGFGQQPGVANQPTDASKASQLGQLGQVVTTPATTLSATGATQQPSTAINPLDIDKRYADLPPHAKAEIDVIYKEYKQPMDAILHEISLQTAPSKLDQVCLEQQTLRRHAKKLKIKQERYYIIYPHNPRHTCT